MNLGEALVAEMDSLAEHFAPEQPVSRGFKNPKAQIGYLLKNLSPAALAERLGISRGTLTRWKNGKTGPSKANAGKLDAAYHEVRDPRARTLARGKRRRTGRARLVQLLTTPPATRIQISGTVAVSDDESYRTNFGGVIPIPVPYWIEIVRLWKKRRVDTAKIGEQLEQAINWSLDAGVQFGFPGDDYTIVILTEG